MKNPNTFRGFVLAVGILIAAGIVLSQVFFHDAVKLTGVEKEKTEQTTPESSATLQASPTLATHSVSVELNQSVDASVQQVLPKEPQQRPLAEVVCDFILPYFKTLLRTLIASNAP